MSDKNRQNQNNTSTDLRITIKRIQEILRELDCNNATWENDFDTKINKKN